MAIRKVIIKNNHMEAVVKIVNDADASNSVTIALATDLLKSNESLTGQALDVAIRNIEWTLADGTGVATIVRNGVTIQRLHSTNVLQQSYGADHEQSSHNIVVNMTGGTIIMHLLKSQGYAGNFKPEQGIV